MLCKHSLQARGDGTLSTASCKGVVHLICGVAVPNTDDVKCLLCDYIDSKAAPDSLQAPPGGEKEAPAPDAPRTTSSTKRKKPTSLNLTHRKTTTAKKARIVQPRMGKQSRVKTTRRNLFKRLESAAQKACLSNSLENNYNFYGNVVGGDTTQGYKVEFDVLPTGAKMVTLKRQLLTVLKEGEDEVDNDHDPLPSEEESDAEAAATGEKNPAAATGKKNPLTASADNFCALSKEHLSTASTYEMKYGKDKNADNQINWEILADGVHVEEDPNEGMRMEIPEKAALKIDLDLETKPLVDTFFEHIFPDVKGHAKKLDEYLSDERAAFHATYTHENIKFHDAEDPDPDWKVKQGFKLIIAAASELENGVSNLWKSGPSNGRRDYPDFGQYMAKNEFKCFQSAIAFCWADKKIWYTDKRDVPWDVFLPCLADFNERRRNLLKTVLLMLDESMSGWRPKTSKLGGLPNYTFESRKPIDLGTMFKNGAEGLTGMYVFQDVVQMVEQQQRKEFFNADTHLPDNSKITAHTAEVLRQVQGANVVEGGWVGGDSWFGSVATAIEVRRRLNVHSTWIIKQNHKLFPKQALSAVLKARHGDRPAGHWVVMRAEIAEVKLFAVAYAWSKKGVSYFLSTCGKTSPAAKMYTTNYEDEFGFIQTRQIDRPDIAHFLYDLLPVIDEHNKQRQSILNLERCWPTKDCWFRLIMTLTGMCVVDFHRLYTNIKSEDDSARNKAEIDALDVRKFSDMLCSSLRKRSRRPAGTLAQFSVARCAAPLARIQGPDGTEAREVTGRQREDGKSVGTSRQMTCFMCRKYLKANGSTRYQNTSFWCKKCQMPLCKVDRSDADPTRILSCIDEHLDSTDTLVGCYGKHLKATTFPKDDQMNLHPRRGSRRGS